MGALLSQCDIEGIGYLVENLSQKLLPREQNRITIERKCLAIKWPTFFTLGRPRGPDLLEAAIFENIKREF